MFTITTNTTQCIIMYAITTLFAFVTLPVEINASQRAVAWLEQAGITDRQTTPMASSALRSAAYTYVVAALASLGTLIYYIWIFTGRRD
jgi:Zn-dependent membrane protease YugP